MKIIADTHTHTLASSHAYSTLYENSIFAQKAGLKWICATDHAPSIPDSPPVNFFYNQTSIPQVINDVIVLRGIEANIIGVNGELDADESLLKTRQWVVASVHVICFSPVSISEQTNAYIKAAQNKYVDVIGHSGLASHPYNYYEAISAIRDAGKLIEINEGSYHSRPESIENCIKIIDICKELNCRIVVNSDSHFCTFIGNVQRSLKLLDERRFPEELIVNATEEQFNSYLNERKARLK